MNKLSSFVKQVTEVNKEIDRLHSDRNQIYNYWQNFGQAKIGEVYITNYLTSKIVNDIIDELNKRLVKAQAELKELEDKLN